MLSTLVSADALRYWFTVPNTAPIAAPTMPMPAASARTVRNAKRRDEPIARNTPSSRRRSSTDNISVFSSATLATKTTIHAMMSMSAVP